MTSASGKLSLVTDSPSPSCNWLEYYLDATAHDNTSLIFKKWTGIYCAAAGLQRRVYAQSLGDFIFPNLYLLLVGPSAAGKGVALKGAEAVLPKIDGQHIASDSLTSASFADELNAALITHIDSKNRPHQYHSLTIISDEFGVFLPEYDSAFLQRLTKLWDNKGFSERRRGNNNGEKVSIEKATVNLIGGTTPVFLNNVLPEGAWHEGFMSRMLVVYAGAMPPVPITQEAPSATTLDTAARELNKLIKKREGLVPWSKTGLEYFNHWHLNGRKPAPEHPKLMTYNERRHFNAIKIATISAVLNGNSKLMEDDIKFALELLFETEMHMPDAFKAMKTGGEQEAMKELWHWMFGEYARRGKPLPRANVTRFLMEKVPAHSVDRVLQVMTSAGLIQQGLGNTYIPIKPES